MSSPSKPTRFGALLFPGFELLDISGPLEALNTLVHMGHDLSLTIISDQKNNSNATSVSTAVSKLSTNTTGAPSPSLPVLNFGSSFSQSWVIDADLDSARASEIDILLIPGGIGCAPYLPPDFKTWDDSQQPYVDYVARVYPKLQYIFTICNGAGLAARAGVLDGRRATTNKTAWAMTTALGRKTHWVARARWIEDGNVWTTAGVSAGTDGMVALIDRVWGDEVAEECCQRMEYLRRADSGDDGFADKQGAEDVLPVE